MIIYLGINLFYFATINEIKFITQFNNDVRLFNNIKIKF